jgi:2-keto-3-deoxy-L-rhamnonate aldolase RhmA
LDIGAMGILVPHVCTEQDARRLADGAYYPPRGRRGVGVGRGGKWGAIPMDEYFRSANDEIVLMAMIEDVEAIENIEAIAAVKLDILFVGTHDLAASYGLLGQISHPRVLAAGDRVVAAARRWNVAVGFPARNAGDATSALQRGYRAIGYGSAENYVVQHGRQFLESVRDPESHPRDGM